MAGKVERLRRELRHWEWNARVDALWSILNDGERTHGRWTRDDFFATGAKLVGDLFARLDRLGLAPRRGRALDFGCGVGRLTQALGDRFDEVVGIDASPTMIAKANGYNRHGARVRHVLCAEPDLGFVPDRSVDFVLSIIVLQHIPPPFAERYLAELARKVAPGGVLVVQAPERDFTPTTPRPSFIVRAGQLVPPRLRRWLRERLYPERPVIRMFPLPRERVLAALAGLQVVASEPDELAAGYGSRTYFARRA
jgi:SAM-dependent methyltransferase